MHTYGLVARPGMDITASSWAFNALHAREALEHLAGQTTTHIDDDGAEWSLTAWTALILIAGSVTDEQGTAIDPMALKDRLPVRPFDPAQGVSP